ncbi:MAG TPA: sigma-70 family RNA polymerase sigma factor [Burkholderiales bacterium]
MEEFERRVTEYIPRLRRYARVLTGNSMAADDLVQDTLERAWSRLRLWRPGSDLRAWLFTIMHNVHVNGVRRRRPEQTGEPLEIAIGGTQEQRLELRDVTRALAQLPRDYREVLLLVAVEEMPYAQAAAVLDVPLGTVMSRLSRARAQLLSLTNGDTTPGLRRVK